MKKTIFLLIAVSLLVFSACSRGLKDASLEGAFSKDSMIVFVTDASNEGQVEKFKTLMAEFPDFGLWKTAISSYDKELKDREGYSYEELVKPILDEGFRVGVAFDVLGEKVDIQNIDKIDEANLELYIGGEFAEADKFEKLLEYALKEALMEDLKIEEDDDITYWFSEKDKVYVMRYKDLFLGAPSRRALDTALVRMEENTGFSSGESFLEHKSQFNEGLGYMFMDGEFMSSVLPGFYSNSLGLNMTDISKKLEGIGDSFILFAAEDEGLTSVTTMKLNKTDLASLRELGVDPEGEVHLMNKVNANGVILYLEGFGFAQALENFLLGFTHYSAQMQGDQKIEETKTAYNILMDQISALSNLPREEVEDLLNAPFAISITDSGSYYPTVSLYIELADEYKDDAQTLNAALNDYVQQLLKELQAIAKAEEGISLDFIASEVEVVSGGAISKVTVDWGKLPPELLQNELFSAINLENLKVELNYGITGDNILVFALYPDFAQAYGKNALADDEIFKEAVGRVNAEKGYQLTYARFSPLVDLVERIVEVVSKSEQGNQESLMIYNLFSGKFFAFLETLKYIVSSSDYEDGVVQVDEFVRIEKVQR